MKSKLPYVVGGVIFVVVTALIVFLVVQSLNNDTDTAESSSASNSPVNEQSDQINDDSTTSMINDTSRPVDGDDSVASNSVSLLDQNVSFFVPADVSEVVSGSTDIYKKYTNVSDCLYVGQDATGSGRESGELVVVAYETSNEDECLNDSEFTTNSNTTIAGYSVEVTEKSGQGGGDILLLNKTEELGNGVSMAFLYKEKYSATVETEVETLLESFEVEL